MGYAEKQNQAVNQMRDDLNRQARRISELERQLADALNGERPPDEHLDPDMLSVTSIVSNQTKQPLIVLRWFTHYAQLNEAAARTLALSFLDAIEAAKSDAFIVNFAMASGVPESKIGAILQDFRDFRNKTEE